MQGAGSTQAQSELEQSQSEGVFQRGPGHGTDLLGHGHKAQKSSTRRSSRRPSFAIGRENRESHGQEHLRAAERVSHGSLFGAAPGGPDQLVDSGRGLRAHLRRHDAGTGCRQVLRGRHHHNVTIWAILHAFWIISRSLECQVMSRGSGLILPATGHLLVAPVTSVRPAKLSI